MFYFQGLHARVITEGFDLAKTKALEVKKICAVEHEILCFLLIFEILFIFDNDY